MRETDREAQPVLLMALDDYFTNPSRDCLARLFDAVNSMEISTAPVLTRHEKLVMRASERKDVFLEKFTTTRGQQDANGLTAAKPSHSANASIGSRSSFEESIMARTKDESDSSSAASTQQHAPGQSSPSEASFSLGGSAVWVGDESGADHTMNGHREPERPSISTTRGRRSVDASSTSSSGPASSHVGIPHVSAGDAFHGIKDTHFFPTTIAYKGHQLPIKMPLSTFPEEVGDVSFPVFPTDHHF
jgi:hypothetical protein